MTIASDLPTQRLSRATGRLPLYVLFALACTGAVIGTLVGFGLYVTKLTYVALLPFGLALLVPALILKNFRLYWFAIFLFSLQFVVTKNLNDGLAVLSELQIDADIATFTFDITASDLVLLVLVAIWANDSIYHRQRMHFPPVAWLAFAYLGACVLSLVGSKYPYLGLVGLVQIFKFVIAFIFALNCLRSKRSLRALAVLAVIIVVTQATVVVGRFLTGYMMPLSLSSTHQDLDEITQYLAMDRTDPNSIVRSFGTLGSPDATTRLATLMIPFSLFLCVRNSMFGARLVFAAAVIFGISGLALTFTRAFYITVTFQVALTFCIMVRDDMLSRRQALMGVLLGLVLIGAAAPKLYEQFTLRPDSVSVRFLQYEATLRMIRDHPFFGVGLNNGTAAKINYNEFTFNPNDPNTQFDKEPTNDLYLSLTSEVGIVGALIFFGFFGRVMFLSWREARRSSDPEIRLVANALFVSLCGLAAAGLINPVLDYQVLMLLWLFAGISLNLSKLSQESDET
ncbi:MAG: O-antigen ligase family protein [Alphaproteobacteria bacterium]